MIYFYNRNLEFVGGGFDGLRISSLLYADVFLLASSSHDLNLALGWFVAKCKATRMTKGIFSSEAADAIWEMTECLRYQHWAQYLNKPHSCLQVRAE